MCGAGRGTATRRRRSEQASAVRSGRRALHRRGLQQALLLLRVCRSERSAAPPARPSQTSSNRPADPADRTSRTCSKTDEATCTARKRCTKLTMYRLYEERARDAQRRVPPPAREAAPDPTQTTARCRAGSAHGSGGSAASSSWRGRNRTHLALLELALGRHLVELEQLAAVRDDGVALHRRGGDDFLTLYGTGKYPSA